MPAIGPERPALRVVLGVIAGVIAVLVALLHIMDQQSTTKRENADQHEIERLREHHAVEIDGLRRKYVTEFATLFGSLAHGMSFPGNSPVFRHFLGECAERFLTLVGNGEGHLRVAIYRLEGREDYETPEDDFLLERITPTAYGRTDLPRMHFKYNNEDERAVITSLREGDIVKWPDLTKHSPASYKQSKKYKAFYTMPVMGPRGDVLGMVTCDSIKVGVLGDHHEQSLRMIAHLVGIGFTMMKQTAQIQRPSPNGDER